MIWMRWAISGFGLPWARTRSSFPIISSGKREARDAIRLTKELAKRVEGRVQINADKLNVYRRAIFAAWGRNVDFGRAS
jgi:hypothetical protein